MSHTTTINAVVLKDTQAIRLAVAALKDSGVKCDLRENVVPRAYSQGQAGMSEAAPFVIQLHDSPYDVGLYPKEGSEGGYEVRADFWAGHVNRNLGAQNTENGNSLQAQMGKFYREYAAHAATRAAVRQGHQVHRVNNDDGSIQLRVAVAA